MYSTKCNNTEFVYVQPSDNLVRHKCDSTNGQSGSPMFDANKNIRAVLTGGSADVGVNSALEVIANAAVSAIDTLAILGHAIWPEAAY